MVSNAETAAHVAVIAREGAGRWRAAGTLGGGGPVLLTLAGSVVTPGKVVELIGSATIGTVLSHGGVPTPPQAVLVGGYAGTWVPGDVAWTTRVDPGALAAAGAARGCGLLGVLPHGACGVAETARLAAYLAGESAGQCGPCVHGLPALAQGLSALARGTAGRRSLRRVRRNVVTLPGSGACRHPDGVARLVASALEVFGEDVARHRRGGVCAGSLTPGVFPLVGPERVSGDELGGLRADLGVSS